MQALNLLIPGMTAWALLQSSYSRKKSQYNPLRNSGIFILNLNFSNFSISNLETILISNSFKYCISFHLKHRSVNICWNMVLPENHSRIFFMDYSIVIPWFFSGMEWYLVIRLWYADICMSCYIPFIWVYQCLPYESFSKSLYMLH